MLRNTKQKQIIKDALLQLNHPTMDEIIFAVQSIDKKISVATIYRNIKQMLQAGELIVISDIVDKFDTTTFNHYHFICEKCNKTYDVEMNYCKELDKQVEAQGFIVKGHNLVFKGICENCKKNFNKELK